MKRLSQNIYIEYTQRTMYEKENSGMLRFRLRKTIDLSGKKSYFYSFATLLCGVIGYVCAISCMLGVYICLRNFVELRFYRSGYQIFIVFTFITCIYCRSAVKVKQSSKYKSNQKSVIVDQSALKKSMKDIVLQVNFPTSTQGSQRIGCKTCFLFSICIKFNDVYHLSQLNCSSLPLSLTE